MQPKIPPRHLQLLTEICNLPTAPYHEHHVIAYLQSWANTHAFKNWQDKAGNLYIEYRRGPKHKKPLIIEAHTDHPGFLATKQRGNLLHAEFHGGVRPSHFQNAPVQFLVNQTWLPAKVLSAKPRKNSRTLDIQLSTTHKIPPNSLGMWQLPDASTKNKIFRAPVCDDLATVAATCALFEELIHQQQKAHVIALFDRAEEVGFAGVLAACLNNSLPGANANGTGGARVIGLETSKALPTAKQGDGVIVRVGDRTGLFSPGFTHFLSQCAAHIADDRPTFKWQRKLMDAGMCNSTPFAAFHHDSAALCLPLGNYHNMHIKNDPGHNDAPTAGNSKLIASETIHLDDYEALIQLLLETVKRLPTYKENFAEIRDRLTKMHKKEHLPTLYRTR
jgi:putative aminopeptidase FrvX